MADQTSAPYTSKAGLADSSTTILGGVTPKPKANMETGVGFAMPFVTPYRNAWEIFRDDQVTALQLVAMRRTDGQARALYRLIVLPIRAALTTCTFVPATGVEGGTDEAEFVQHLLTLPASGGGMLTPWSLVMAQVLQAVFDGFSPFEMVYWSPTKGPLKGKWTLKKLAWRPPQSIYFLLDKHGDFYGFRQRCLTADTEVPLLDGTTARIDELAKRWDAGERFWVYSSTEDGKVVPGKVTGARKVSDLEPLVEVELDNGERVRCTLTHPWMLRDGTYKRAANLRPGDSLMPLYRRQTKLAQNSQEYEQVWHPGRGKWEPTHQVVSRECGFPAGRGHVIHHGFDGLCHLNNDPRNLQRLTNSEHIELHNKLSHNGGIQRAHEAWNALGHEERSRQSSERARKRWQNPDYRAGGADRLKAARENTDPAEWGNHRHDITFAKIKFLCEEMVKEGLPLTLESVTSGLKCTIDVVHARIEEAGYSSWKEFKWTLVQRDKKWQKKQAFNNHKVVAVREVEPEAVYDIEVEDYHNFALKAGVFVHNTYFMGRSIDEIIGPEAATYYACQEEERKFYGQSMFEAAWYHWDKKVRLYFVAHLAAQRAATGTRVGHLPPSPTPEEQGTFVKALSDLGFAQYLAVPDGYSVDLLKEGTQFPFLDYINHHNSQMSKSILAPFFDDKQGAGNETSLVDFGQQSDAMFILMLDTIMAEVEAFINDKIIPRFIDWNFNSGKYPKFRFGQLTAEQKGVLTDMFKTLAVISNEFQSCTPEFMHELEKQVAEELGLEIDYEDVEKRMEESAKLAEAEAKAAPPPMFGQPQGGAAGGLPKTPNDPQGTRPPQPPRTAGPVQQSRHTGQPNGGPGIGRTPRTASGGGKLKFTEDDTAEGIQLTGLARELLLDAAGPPIQVHSLEELNKLMEGDGE